MYWKALLGLLAVLAVEFTLIVLNLFFGFPGYQWLFVVTACFFLVALGGLVIAYLRVTSGAWEHFIDRTIVSEEHVSIPVADGWSLAALVMKPRDCAGTPRPAVICHHGLSGNGEKMLDIAVPLAMHGYTVIVPDARGHGKSKKLNKSARMDDWYVNDEVGIFPDLHKIVDYAISRRDVDPNRIAMTGTSMGGAVCLTTGLLDARVKLVIAACSIYSFTDVLTARRARVPFTEPWFMKNALHLVIDFKKILKVEPSIAPCEYFKKIPVEKARDKVRLIHARNDELVLFEASAEKIIDALGIPGSNVLVTAKGGHALRGQETIIVAKTIEWLHQAL